MSFEQYKLPKFIEVYSVVATGRSGSDFLCSLLDNCEQIMSFPGKWNYDQFYNEVSHLIENNEPNFKKIAEHFVNKPAHSFFFDSRRNKIEFLGRLGDDKSAFFCFLERNFVNIFENVCHCVDELNYTTLFYAIFISYDVLKYGRRETYDNMLIVYNAHYGNVALPVVKSDLMSKIILTTRNPISMVRSGTNNYITNYPQSVCNLVYFNLINRIHYAENELINSGSECIVVYLERLHEKPDLYLRRLSRELKIKFDPKILTSTFCGIKWFGDNVSRNYMDGFNKKVETYSDLSHIYFSFLSALFRDVPIYQYYYQTKTLYSISSVNSIWYYLRYFWMLPELNILVFCIKSNIRIHRAIRSFLYSIFLRIFHRFEVRNYLPTNVVTVW